MILELYSLRDRAQGYTTPIPFANKDVADRWFKEMRAENITVKLSPEDFELYSMGTFDTETGKIESEVVKVYV